MKAPEQRRLSPSGALEGDANAPESSHGQYLDTRRRPLLMRSIRIVIKTLLRAYFRLYHQMHIDGVEYVPKSGAFLAVMNHGSVLDPPILLASMPVSYGVIPAKISLFKNSFFSTVLAACGAVPVRRTKSDVDIARLLLRTLRAGIPVGVTAEGTRTRTGTLQPFLPQVAKLALLAGCPVVPVTIRGSYNALPPGVKWPRRTPIAVFIRPVIDPRTAVASFPKNEQPEQLALLMRAAVAELL